MRGDRCEVCGVARPPRPVDSDRPPRVPGPWTCLAHRDQQSRVINAPGAYKIDDGEHVYKFSGRLTTTDEGAHDPDCILDDRGHDVPCLTTTDEGAE